MERIPNAADTPEFRAEAVKLVEAVGLTAGQAAKRLSMPKARLQTYGPERRPVASVGLTPLPSVAVLNSRNSLRPMVK